VTYEEQIEAAHAARVSRLRSATGWLSLVDKIFLGQGMTKLRLPDGSSTGDIFVKGTHVELDGRVLASDRHGRADAVNVNGFVLELMERGETLALRIRDHRELPRPFAGISRFAVDRSWRKRARLVSYPAEREVALDFEGATASGGVTDVFLSPGVLEFEHDGVAQRLEVVWEGETKTRLFVLFRDATSGQDSYALGRFVYADAPDAEGETNLDFNLAMLPGCAFSVYATCPIPPPQNRLSIAVHAGERVYEGTPIGQP
jgi:uncharacterized protein